MTNDLYTLSSVYDDGKCVRITIICATASADTATPIGTTCERKLVLPHGAVYEKKNDKLDHDRVVELVYRASEYSAYKKGLELLAYGDNTKSELVRKLVAKGHSEEHAENAAARLEADGYIKESEHCLRRALIEAEKCYGKRYISAKLYSLGFSRNDIRSALEALDAEFDFSSALERYVRRHGLYDTLIGRDVNARNKALASLMRRGFSFDEIKKALSYFEC